MTAHRCIPVDVAFRGLAADADVEARCARWAYELERVDPRIRRCHVSIDCADRIDRQQPRYAVRVVMIVDGCRPITTRARDGQHDLQLAIADAFLAVRGLLHTTAA